jgi:hypothetical protein
MQSAPRRSPDFSLLSSFPSIAVATGLLPNTPTKTATFPEDRHTIYVAVFAIFGGLRPTDIAASAQRIREETEETALISLVSSVSSAVLRARRQAGTTSMPEFPWPVGGHP